jgi:hypothetical protein
MASVLQIASPDAVRRIQRVQTVTIAWMSVEALVSSYKAPELIKKPTILGGIVEEIVALSLLPSLPSNDKNNWAWSANRCHK